jgi:hypothetical protein
LFLIPISIKRAGTRVPRGKLRFLGLRQGICKLTLELLVASESKERKNTSIDGDMSKEHKSQLKELSVVKNRTI